MPSTQSDAVAHTTCVAGWPANEAAFSTLAISSSVEAKGDINANREERLSGGHIGGPYDTAMMEFRRMLIAGDRAAAKPTVFRVLPAKTDIVCSEGDATLRVRPQSFL